MENNGIMIDTNIVILLAEYNVVQSIDIMMQRDKTLTHSGAVAIEQLYKLIDKKEIDVYISELTLDEINQGVRKYGTSTKDYLIQSNIEIAEMSDEQIRLSEKLGNHYFTYKTVFGDYAFDTHDEKYNGVNDAFLMSDATILGLDFVTFDKHFIQKEYTIIEANRMFKKHEPLAQYRDSIRPLMPSRALQAIQKKSREVTRE